MVLFENDTLGNGSLVQVCGYVWVQSMRMLGASPRLRLGAEYADVGSKSAARFGCKVWGCWVQVS